MCMVNINTRYNFDLNCYPLLKLKEIYPIDNTVALTVSAIPISDLYSSYLEEHIGELCNQLKKDLILRVNIPNVAPGTMLGINYLSVEDLSDNCDSYHNSCDEYDDEDDDYEEEDDEEDDPEYNMIKNDFDNESYMDKGLYYNFSRVFPVIDAKGNEIYRFEDNIYEYNQARTLDDAASSEINKYIDTDGEDWMFLFQFRHLISYASDLNPSCILQPETIKMADRVTYSLINTVCGGMYNITNTETMKLIVSNMIEVAASYTRAPFVGNIRFQVLPERFSEEIQYNYMMWNTELYNLMLEDFVDFEESITPPFTIAKGEYYFKPTDFLGEYYFPHGIKSRKEEENGGKETDTKESIDTEKVDKKRNIKESRSTGNSKRSSGNSTGGRASRSRKSTDIDK